MCISLIANACLKIVKIGVEVIRHTKMAVWNAQKYVTSLAIYFSKLKLSKNVLQGCS